MIAIPKEPRVKQSPSPWHEGFLAMLPALRRRAAFALRRLPPEAREDATADVLARAAVAFERLHRQGRAELAFAAPLAHFGLAQYRVGRRVGSRWHGRDVMSSYAQRRRGVAVRRLDQFDDKKQAWKEIMIEDQSITPAELACSRLDFAAWLDTLSLRDRQLAETLAAGETTKRAAKLFDISPGRVSQLRNQLQRAWLEFNSEQPRSAACVL